MHCAVNQKYHIFHVLDTRKVTFTKEQMENWKPLSEETFKNVARTIETAKQ